MLHELAQRPRLVGSTESTSLEILWSALVGTNQSLQAHAIPTPYGWHEYGIYVSIEGLMALFLAWVFVWGRRESALKAVGTVLFILGLGAFHPAAP